MWHSPTLGKKKMNHFMISLVSVWIQNLSSEVTLTSINMALKSGPFFDSLCKKPSATLDELRARTVRFTQMEEMTKFKEKVSG